MILKIASNPFNNKSTTKTRKSVTRQRKTLSSKSFLNNFNKNFHFSKPMHRLFLKPNDKTLFMNMTSFLSWPEYMPTCLKMTKQAKSLLKDSYPTISTASNYLPTPPYSMNGKSSTKTQNLNGWSKFMRANNQEKRKLMKSFNNKIFLWANYSEASSGKDTSGNGSTSLPINDLIYLNSIIFNFFFILSYFLLFDFFISIILNHSKNNIKR